MQTKKYEISKELSYTTFVPKFWVYVDGACTMSVFDTQAEAEASIEELAKADFQPERWEYQPKAGA